jgi:L-asparaginase
MNTFSSTRVHIIATGGTIASRTDPESGAALPTLSAQDLVAAVPALRTVAQVTFEQFANLGSHALTLDQLVGLGRRVKDVLDRRQADGVVITQGTMTMEESSYLWDLMLARSGAVIVTGAMRHSSLPSPDGPRNLLDAVIAAASPATRGLGVLVCMNGELHAARDVVKFHSLSVESFRSPEVGAIGFVRSGRVDLRRTPAAAQHEPMLAHRISASVALVPIVAADDGRLIAAASQMADGLVLQLMGGGAVPPPCVPVIAKAVERAPVIGVSRCAAGSMYENVYAFEGGDKQLRELGVIFAGSLTGLKARLRLMLHLSAHPRPAPGSPEWPGWQRDLTAAFPNV